MARVKMNNEYRTKISNQVRNALDNDKLNSKREAYYQHLEIVKEQYPKFFDEAKTIVQRSYPKEHCDTLNHFKTPVYSANPYQEIHRAVMHPYACSFLIDNFSKERDIICED